MTNTYKFIINGSGKTAMCTANSLRTAKEQYICIDSRSDAQEEVARFCSNNCVLIDFSHHSQTQSVLALCYAFSIPLVIGTTGQTHKEIDAIQEASRVLPIVLESNFSIGIHLLCQALIQVFKTNSHRYQWDIIEYHGLQKADKPSGTALKIARSICQCDNCIALDSRNDTTNIVLHSLRGGDASGRHDVVASGIGESIILSHISHGREVYAKGAIMCAKWLRSQNPSLYTLSDYIKSRHNN